MTYEEFITGIRAKYPEYNDVDDESLVDSVLQKYPVYREQIDPVTPYNPNEQYYPGSYTPIEFEEPEEGEEELSFWGEITRGGYKQTVEHAGQIPGTVMNILGTVPSGEHPTFTGYGMALMPGVDKDEVPVATKYVSPKEAKKLTEENQVFQTGEAFRKWPKDYIESHPELKDPENMQELSWGTFYKPAVIGRVIGEGIPSVIASIGSGVAATAVTGNPIVGMAMSMTVAGGMEGSSAYTTAKEYGKLSYEDQAKVGVLVGSISSMISFLPIGNIIGKMGVQPVMKQELAKKIINLGLYKHIGVNTLKQGVFEATEETLQEFTNIVAETVYMEDADEPTWQEGIQRMAHSAYGGFLLGETTGATVGAVQASGEYEQAKVDVFKTSKAGQEIERARESGDFDDLTLNYAANFAKQNPEVFEDRSVLEFVNESREITTEQLKAEGRTDKEIEAFFAGEGLEGATEAQVLGSTLEANGQVLINLYKGADPTTVVEEFYGNHFRLLSEDSKAIWSKYFTQYKDEGGKLTSQELFEKNGTEYYFNEGLYKNTTVQQIFRKVKGFLNDIFGRSTLDPEIRKMYEDAGFGKVEDVSPDVEADESFQLVEHYSNIPGLDELVTAASGTGKMNRQELQENLKRIYFYEQGEKPESIFRKHDYKYTADLDEEAYYDVDEDQLKLLEKSYIKNKGMAPRFSQQMLDDNIKEAGFAGFTGEKGLGRRAYVSYEDVPVTEVYERKEGESFQLVPAQKKYFKDTKVVDESGDPRVMYHATNAAFTEFQKGDIGFHFGTASQAKDRISAPWMNQEGGRTIPAYLNIKNPLRMTDIGRWDNAYDVQGELVAQTDLKDIPNPDSVPYEKRFDVLRDYLKEQGYDGIVYRNTHEGMQPEDALLEGKDRDSWDWLRTEGTETERVGFLRDMEASREYAGDQLGSDSYIAFDPEQIKSPFNLKPVETGESFQLAPTTLSIHSIIEDKNYPTFKNINAIAKHLAERTKKIQEEEGIDLSDMSTESKEIIAQTLAAEIETELKNPKNAGSWYTIKMANAFKQLEKILPEIGKDPTQKSLFNIGLALTSNGTAVQENMGFAVRAYEYKQEYGEFPTHFLDMGTESGSINKGFKLYNELSAEHGEDAFLEFLRTEFTKKELEGLGFKVSDENVNTRLPGSVIFGPKVGGAFYANLEGDLTRLTMDRWFTRTWGRIVGTIDQKMTSTIKKNFTKFKQTIRNSKKQMDKYGLTREDTYNDEIMLDVASKVFRDFGKDWDKKTVINRLSRSIVMNTGIQNDPKNGTRRNHMRDVMNRVVELLDNPDVSVANAQALLWFPEKRLFSKLRGAKPSRKGSEELDYEEAAKRYIKSRGITDEGRRGPLHTKPTRSDQKGGTQAYQEAAKAEEVTQPSYPPTPAGTGESFQLVPKDQLDLSEETRVQFIERMLVDELSRLKYIQRQAGDKPESQDAYMFMQNSIGRTTARQDEIRDEIYKGKKSILKRLTNAGYSLDDLGEYLYARHAKERNAAMELKGKPSGSGMTDVQADEILKKYRGKDMKKFSDEWIKNTIKQALDIRLEAGLINKAQYKTLKSYYKNYVPLKGVIEDDQFTYQPGKGFSVTSSTVMTAHGRETRAQNPAVQAVIDLESAIVAAEKNRAMQSLYELLKENPHSSWKLSGRKHKPVYDENGEMHLEPGQLADNEVQVFFDGEKKVIQITDEALLKAVTKTTRSGTFAPILRGLQTFNTYFRAVVTNLSPEFITSNFQRDLQTALVHLGSKHPAKVAGRVVKDIPKSMKSIWKDRDDWKDFKRHGGKVGWMDFKTIDEKTQELTKSIDFYHKAGKFREAVLSTGQFISDVNEVVENGVRLSTYNALVANGMSKDKAANYAKDLTVNFNKKGEWGNGMNALYVFSNAGIQGTNRMYRTLTDKDPKVRAKVWGIMGGIAAFGFLSSLRNRWEDKEDWEQFSDYEKDNHLMYMLPKNKKGKTNSIKVRLPYGYNVPFVMGQLAEQMINGDMQMGEAMSRLMKAGLDSFLPISGGSRAQFVTPTILDPLIQIDENKNFFGGPIAKETKYGAAPKPSERHFENVRPTTKVVTKWLSENTGGKGKKAGVIEINPARVDHIINSYGGGLFKFLTNSLTTSETFIREGQFPAYRHIPIVRKFISEKSEYQARSIVYKMLDKSGYTKFNKEMKARFKRQLDYAKKSGQITAAQHWDIKEDFNNNQRELK